MVVQKHPILLINCILNFVIFACAKTVHTPTKSDFNIAAIYMPCVSVCTQLIQLIALIFWT